MPANDEISELVLRMAFAGTSGAGAATWMARLDGAGISLAAATRIVAVARATARAVAFPLLGPIEPRRSKFGGMPDAPRDFVWPRRQGEPLAFLAQIRIAELPAEVRASLSLPVDGVIAFFYDAADNPVGHEPDLHRDGSVLALWPQVDALGPHGAPADLDDAWITPECSVRFVEELTLPAPGSPAFESLRLDDETRLAYATMTEVDDDHLPHHYVGGHALPMQRTMEDQVALHRRGISTRHAVSAQQLAAVAPEAEKMRLILQLDEDWFAPFLVDPGHCLYVWMHADDLASQRFDRACCVVQ